MSRFLDAILNMIRPYQMSILIFFVIILFTVVGHYTYVKYGKPEAENKEFKDVANAVRRDGNKVATLKMYWVDWCPYCKSASDKEEKTGPWAEFKKQYDGKKVGSHKLKCERVDCSENNGTPTADYEAVKAEMQKHDVKSFPTIKMFMEDGKTIEFDSKVSKESLEKFVNTVL